MANWKSIYQFTRHFFSCCCSDSSAQNVYFCLYNFYRIYTFLPGTGTGCNCYDIIMSRFQTMDHVSLATVELSNNTLPSGQKIFQRNATRRIIHKKMRNLSIIQKIFNCYKYIIRKIVTLHGISWSAYLLAKWHCRMLFLLPFF